MEDNQVNNHTDSVVQEQQMGGEKMSQKSIIGLVILTIIALAGVAFGVWGMMGKDQAEKDLAIKIKEANGTVTEIETDKIVSTDEDGTVTEITDTNATTSAVNPEDYIYVGEWGMKIKIPENLKAISYRYTYGANSTSVAFWGAYCSGQCNYYPDFVDPHKNSDGLGIIIRYPKGAEVPLASQPVLVFSDDEYDYRYAHVQAVYSTDESEKDHEVETVDLITEMLRNPENYSKI